MEIEARVTSGDCIWCGIKTYNRRFPDHFRKFLIFCPVCREPVNNISLRTEYPKCPNEHTIGRWVSCQNVSEKHVFLEYANSDCPYCENKPEAGVPEGVKVKCLHATDEGFVCITRPFLWIKEGPPCFMNHVAKMRLVQ